VRGRPASLRSYTTSRRAPCGTRPACCL
jgi:hypothetical protein